MRAQNVLSYELIYLYFIESLVHSCNFLFSDHQSIKAKNVNNFCTGCHKSTLNRGKTKFKFGSAIVQ